MIAIAGLVWLGDAERAQDIISSTHSTCIRRAQEEPDTRSSGRGTLLVKHNHSSAKAYAHTMADSLLDSWRCAVQRSGAEGKSPHCGKTI